MAINTPDYEQALNKAQELQKKLRLQHGSSTELRWAMERDEDYARAYGKLEKEIDKMDRYAASNDLVLVEKQLGNLTHATCLLREHLLP